MVFMLSQIPLKAAPRKSDRLKLVSDRSILKQLLKDINFIKA
jgi:hypothetical protein